MKNIHDLFHIFRKSLESFDFTLLYCSKIIVKDSSNINIVINKKHVNYMFNKKG